MKLEIKNISFEYMTNVPVLRNVSLSFKEGELVSIIGRNGVGKTTLALLLVGMLKYTQGDILLDEISLKKKSIAEVASRIGLVFQNPNTMIFTQKVHDELMLSLQRFEISLEQKEKRIEEMYEFFDLAKYRNTHPRLLSRGEKQKLSLATVLVQNPEVIILDEPFSGIDGNQKQQITQLLIKLKKQGKLIILITHDIDTIIEIADRIIALKETKITFDGATLNFFLDENSLENIGLMKSRYFSLLCKLRDVDLPREIMKMDDLIVFLNKAQSKN